MPELIGFLAMSHGPQLMVKPDQWNVLHNDRNKNLQPRPELEKETLDDKWAKFNRCMKAIEVLRHKLEEWKPDVLVMVADDQHENILDDANPPFTVYIGGNFEASTSLNYFKEPKSANRTKYKTTPELARGILEKLMDSGFDPAYSKELRYDGGMGHAFSRLLKFLTPNAEIPVIPIMVNTYFPPAPSAKRCGEFGRALASVIGSMPEKAKVVIIASGGLSHTVIDEALDHDVLDAIIKNDMTRLSKMPSSTLIAGTSEIRNWIAVAAAADRRGNVVDYVPAYRTPTGVGCGMGFAYWNGSAK
jgi:Catalytic LigB subunit of aromatic ring-opening dioxygenase